MELDNSEFEKNLWSEFDIANKKYNISLLEQNNYDKINDKSENTDVCENCKCSSINFIKDIPAGDLLCSECGFIVSCRQISEEAEWNNYMDDKVGGFKNASRCGLAEDPTNPFSTLSTFVPKGTMSTTFVKDSNGNTKLVKYDLSKWHAQIALSTKCKSFNDASNLLNEMCVRMNLPKFIVTTIKEYWSEIMNNKRVTRAAVRKGLMASCIYYACIYHKIPRNISELSDILCIDVKEITKGDKVFREVIENSNYQHALFYNMEVEDLFTRHCDKLNIQFKYITEMVQINDLCSKELEAVAPLSATAGIICYVIKVKHKIKKPTKTEISKVVGVCNPTLNKVVDIIKKKLITSSS